MRMACSCGSSVTPHLKLKRTLTLLGVSVLGLTTELGIAILGLPPLLLGHSMALVLSALQGLQATLASQGTQVELGTLVTLGLGLSLESLLNPLQIVTGWNKPSTYE